MRFRLCAFCLLLVGLEIGAATLGFSQYPNPIPPFPSQTAPEDDAERVRREHEMARKANQARQRQLKRDTDNLLKLATELKQYVDKSNENTLSVEVIKKADEIERLARSVKDKMKGN